MVQNDEEHYDHPLTMLQVSFCVGAHGHLIEIEMVYDERYLGRNLEIVKNHEKMGKKLEKEKRGKNYWQSQFAS